MKRCFLKDATNVSVAALLISAVGFSAPIRASLLHTDNKNANPPVLQKIVESDPSDPDMPAKPEIITPDVGEEGEAATEELNPEEPLPEDAFDYRDLLESELQPETEGEIRAVERLKSLMEEEDSDMDMDAPEVMMPEFPDSDEESLDEELSELDPDLSASPAQSLANVRIIRPEVINVASHQQENTVAGLLPEDRKNQGSDEQPFDEQPKLISSTQTSHGVRIIRMGESAVQETGFTVIKGFDN